jgi:hypothetical protein
MATEFPKLLAEFVEQAADYLPTFVAGLILLGLGVFVGWLRLDRLGGRMGWRAAFGKGDVRAALYGLVGTIAMVLVVLVFLDNTLQIWGLEVLSRSIHAVIVYTPNLLLVGVIVAVGLILANAVARRVEDTLEEERAPRPRLVAKTVRAALLGLVAALALWQLGLARQIVLAAFLIIFGAAGIAFALSVGLGTAKAVQRGWESFLDGRKENGKDAPKR